MLTQIGSIASRGRFIGNPPPTVAVAMDGTDRSGRVVAPGIYLAQLRVDVDADPASRTSTQRVIYVAY